MTAWPSWVTRQRRERGILAMKPRIAEAFHETRDLGAAPGIGVAAAPNSWLRTSRLRKPWSVCSPRRTAAKMAGARRAVGP